MGVGAADFVPWSAWSTAHTLHRAEKKILDHSQAARVDFYVLWYCPSHACANSFESRMPTQNSAEMPKKCLLATRTPLPDRPFWFFYLHHNIDNN